jgi:O-antigen ligase
MILVYFLIGFMVLFLEIGFALKENKFTGLILPITFLIIAIYSYIPVITNGQEFTDEVRTLVTVGLVGFIVSTIAYLTIRVRKKGGK